MVGSCGAGPVPGAADPDLATDDAGSALVATGPREIEGASVQKFAWDGKLLWSKDTGFIDAVALAPSGEAYLAGRGIDPLVPGAPAPPTGWTTQLVELGADGTYQWSVRTDALGYVSALRTTAKGTMVLLADRAGTLTWGDSTVDNGGLVLAVLEADGRPRWARGVERLWPALLGVDPTGRAVVGGSPPGCGAVTLRAFDLANTPLWTRTVPSDGACGSFTFAQALAYAADHEVTVGVSFSGTITVAGDRLVSQAEDGPRPRAGALSTRGSAAGRAERERARGRRLLYTRAIVVDTHCHLDVAAFEQDRDAVLARARSAGVTDVVIPAIGPAGWERLRALALGTAASTSPSGSTRSSSPSSLPRRRPAPRRPRSGARARRRRWGWGSAGSISRA